LSGLSFGENYLASTNDLFWEKKWGLESDGYRFIKVSSNSSNLKQMLQMDQTHLLPQVLLKKVDISTMQSSLESRTVFFTPELMQFAASLPEELLIKGTTTKVLLRHLAKRLLPTGVFKLPKRGFETPLIALVNGALKDVIQDHLLSNSAGIYSYFPKKVIEAILRRNLRISEDRRSKMIYCLFAMEYWLQHRKTYLRHPQ
jgi:asparagine synthase (glutamine-hydrolysing)